jgi:hypothetical protein
MARNPPPTRPLKATPRVTTHAKLSNEHGWLAVAYSSFHRDVRAGIFPEDWAGEIEIAGTFGERP